MQSVEEDKASQNVWENFKPENTSNKMFVKDSTVLFDEKQRQICMELIRKVPIYPDFRHAVNETASGRQILLSSLLRMKLDDGNYYVSEIHYKSTMDYFGDQVDAMLKITKEFHKFVYLNIAARKLEVNELDVLDVTTQMSEAERLEKLMRQ